MEQKLIKAGWKKFDHSSRSVFCKLAYQKRYSDKKGIKYHIECYQYDYYGNNPVPLWHFETQLRDKKGDAINIETVQWFMTANKYSKPRTIKEVESMVEKLWIALGKVYYEKYGE